MGGERKKGKRENKDMEREIVERKGESELPWYSLGLQYTLGSPLAPLGIP